MGNKKEKRQNKLKVKVRERSFCLLWPDLASLLGERKHWGQSLNRTWECVRLRKSWTRNPQLDTPAQLSSHHLAFVSIIFDEILLKVSMTYKDKMNVILQWKSMHMRNLGWRSGSQWVCINCLNENLTLSNLKQLYFLNRKLYYVQYFRRKCLNRFV